MCHQYFDEYYDTIAAQNIRVQYYIHHISLGNPSADTGCSNYSMSFTVSCVPSLLLITKQGQD